MNNLDLVFLFLFSIFLFIIYNKSDDKDYKQNKLKNKSINKSINKSKYIVNNEVNNIYLEDDTFYKKNYTNNYDRLTHINEIKLLNRGKINRQSIISEKGGSKIFKKYNVQSNINNNSIKNNVDNKSYRKLPYKLNK